MMQRSGNIKQQVMLLLFLAVEGPVFSFGGDTLTLFSCHRLAMETHPVHIQKDLFMRSKELKQENYSAGWYPSLDLNGRYTWQNEVVQIPIPITVPGFEEPAMPHYNYKLTLDVEQTLYDGGMSRKGKELEEAICRVNQQSVEVTLNRVKEEVNRVYFYVLVLQQQEEIIRLKLETLEERILKMESRVRNEMVPKADMNILLAEKLNVEQQLAETDINRTSALEILQELTSREITENTVLVLPETEIQPDSEIMHPEEFLYDLQIQNLEAGMDLAGRKRYPKAFVFGQFGYGNPALDFFRDEFRGYYILGAGLHWNVWDWSKTDREKQEMAVQQDILRSRKEAFEKNLEITLENLVSDIAKFEEAVRRDREILELRREITLSATSRLENGVITSSDYLTELNAEMEARTRLNLHRIQLEQARIAYMTQKGAL
jgi:outer membrane protein TolC